MNFSITETLMYFWTTNTRTHTHEHHLQLCIFMNKLCVLKLQASRFVVPCQHDTDLTVEKNIFKNIRLLTASAGANLLSLDKAATWTNERGQSVRSSMPSTRRSPLKRTQISYRVVLKRISRTCGPLSMK